MYRFLSYWADIQTLIRDALLTVNAEAKVTKPLGADALVVNITKFVRPVNQQSLDITSKLQSSTTDAVLKFPGLVIELPKDKQEKEKGKKNEKDSLFKKSSTTATTTLSYATTGAPIHALRRLGINPADLAQIFASSLHLPAPSQLSSARLFMRAAGPSIESNWHNSDVTAIPTVSSSSTPSSSSSPSSSSTRSSSSSSSSSSPASASQLFKRKDQESSKDWVDEQKAKRSMFPSRSSQTSKALDDALPDAAVESDSAVSNESSAVEHVEKSVSGKKYSYDDSADASIAGIGDGSVDTGDAMVPAHGRKLLSAENVFDELWTAIRTDLPKPSSSTQVNDCDENAQLSVFVYGDEMPLVAAKIGRIIPSANILSVSPSQASSRADDLIKYLQVENVVQCSRFLNTTILDDVGDQTFDIAVLGMDILQNLLLYSPQEFMLVMKRLTQLANTVYLHAPQPELLIHLIQVFGADAEQYNEENLKGMFSTSVADSDISV